MYIDIHAQILLRVSLAYVYTHTYIRQIYISSSSSSSLLSTFKIATKHKVGGSTVTGHTYTKLTNTYTSSTHKHMYAGTRSCISLVFYAYLFTCIYVHICFYVQVDCIHIRMCTYGCAYMYTYIYVRTHTQTHTHTHSNTQVPTGRGRRARLDAPFSGSLRLTRSDIEGSLACAEKNLACFRKQVCLHVKRRKVYMKKDVETRLLFRHLDMCHNAGKNPA